MPTEPSPRPVRPADSGRPRRATGPLALAAALTLTACTSSGDTTTSASVSTGSPSAAGSGSAAASSAASAGTVSTGATVPVLDWAACPAAGSPTAPDLSSFQCATAAVPLDYSDPAGKSIDLAVVRHPATDPSAKIGTLAFNPGGPGGTGTGQFPAWFSFFPAELQQRFDIVSWDPRGVGESTATQRFDTPDAEGELLGALEAFPIGADQEKQWVDTYSEFGQRCAERAGDLLERVSTRDTARDLNLLRQAVGEQKITYLGISYGTFLGATYANLFPDTVRAMVFDGNVSPDAWTNNGQATATESINTRIGSDVSVNSTLHDLLTLCGQTTTDRCAFSAGSADATVQKWNTLLTRLQQQPATIGAPGAQETVSYPALVSSVGNALDFVQAGPGIQGWTGAATVMQEIWEDTEAAPASAPQSPAAANPSTAGSSPMSNPVPTAVSTLPSQAPPAVESYVGPEQTLSVECADAPSPPTSAWPALAQAVFDKAGISGTALSWGDEICSTWRAKAAETSAGPWDAATAAPILVIGNTQDPSTPLQNSQAMAKLLANARLLTMNGYGHTAFLNPSSCVNDAEVAYFVDGTLPAEGTTCEQDKAPFAG